MKIQKSCFIEVERALPPACIVGQAEARRRGDVETEERL